MSEKSVPNAAANDATPGWADLWQTFSDSSKQIAEAWSNSMAPFMLSRLLEQPQGFAAGNEMLEVIEKMAQGPRLADVWESIAKWRSFRRLDGHASKAGEL